MKKDLIVKIAIIIALSMATVALVIGFVTVNKLSNMDKKAKQEANESKYSLKFDKSSLKETVQGKTLTDKENTGVSGTNITGVVAFKEKGDSITYTWDIVNDGTKDAILNELPVIYGLNNNDKQAIEYEFIINDQKATENTIIEAGDTAAAKLTIKYKNNSPVSINPTTIQVISLTFDFSQK